MKVRKYLPGHRLSHQKNDSNLKWEEEWWTQIWKYTFRKRDKTCKKKHATSSNEKIRADRER